MRTKVFMEGKHDCGAACLAMALGFMKASDVHKMLGHDPNKSKVLGMYDQEILACLYAYGKNCQLITTKEYACETQGIPIEYLEDRTTIPTKAALQIRLGMMQNGCAIIVVPSLGGWKGDHYVFCERGEMHDPTPLPRARYNGSAKSADVKMAIFIP